MCDDPPKQKRGRQSRPKVKTGCTNCKQRRIKCDEKRPACTQCVRSHKDCTGYPPPPRHAVPYAELRIAPKPAVAAAAPTLASNAGTSFPGRERGLPPRRLNRQQQTAQSGRGGDSISPAGFAPSPAGNPSLDVYRPANSIPLKGIEMQYFDLFRIHTTSELSGYFDSVFWTQRVLQECHSEPAVRHATIALGALYKTLEQSWQSPSPTDESNPVPPSSTHDGNVMGHWQVAVRQYSEACNAMMLLDGQAPGSHRTRLMASVLLGSFDAFIGDHKQAIIQVQNGLGLLATLRLDRPGQHNSGLYGIEEELVTIFRRLAIQAKSYDLAFHFQEPYVIRLDPEEPLPESSSAPYPERPSSFLSAPSLDRQFANLRDARLAYDRLCERGLRFIERLHQMKRHPFPLFPASWRQYSLGFQTEIDDWSNAFRPLFDSRFSSPHLTVQERSGIATLKMMQINIKIIMMCLFNSTESHFEVFMPQFQQIVSLGQEIIANDEREARDQRCAYPQRCLHRRYDDPADVTAGGYTAYHIRPSFSAEMGIVPPLFVVATKCREGILRRKAIALLRSSSRREGMWDSGLAARVAQLVMDLEEADGPAMAQPQQQQQQQQGMPLRVDTSAMGSGYIVPHGASPASRNRPISEEKRLMIQSIDFDLRARFADLQVGTRSAGNSMAEADDKRRLLHIVW
ncbi:uncharacterized protein F5Z01DRAFT_673299 [Emericellopsis atlantica]|uniref:Zn(2)-C6 fungal-type domain-containing protein n=1 Tax=Emericellopsis atlantica TaxID=2614577 RepID=A0A9P7ZPK1_9HYPO|nr:uncharacterized protein F5Z01DRAFT_673299 [Emericellopsis atlantica]KAG9255348.1 hypothetical protein F5Z01DRAFT_673299 [Emericellopsis atlantica]